MKFAKGILLVWILVWLISFFRYYVFNPSLLSQYCQLVRTDGEGRRAIVYGIEYCHFLNFCRESLPAHSRFKLVGPPESSLDRVRAHYYLYPLRISDNPDFLVVYKDPSFKTNNTVLFASWDRDSFILKVQRN
jgi:hypothetical protein